MRSRSFSSRPARTPYARVALAILPFMLSVSVAIAQSSLQKSFPTPSDAVDALVAAAKTTDAKAAISILGPDAKKVISSGDAIADKEGREQFLQGYDRMHRLAYNSEGQVILYIGADNWPFPIPLVEKNGSWEFDTPAGLKEILYRRIGANELFTIGTLKTLVEAQSKYAAELGDDAYAQHIMSSPGTRDGLFWRVTYGKPESPIGPLVASATAEGYGASSGRTKPFHGYLYRVLTRQGPDAQGGATDYLVDGKMTKGFAFIAYPSEYRSTGVMSFEVNQDGTVFQKDLGPDTANAVSKIDAFNPDKSWTAVEEYAD